MSHPLISVILIGDSVQTKIEMCLDSLKKVDFPRNQLEYLLILPNNHPFQHTMDDTENLKIIRFDEVLQWSRTTVIQEGLSLVKGDYTQVLNTTYIMDSKWFMRGLTNFSIMKTLGIKGRIKGERSLLEEHLELKNTKNEIKIINGLYNTKALKNYMQRYLQHPNRLDTLAEIIKFVPDIMAYTEQPQRSQFSSSNLNVRNRLLTIFLR